MSEADRPSDVRQSPMSGDAPDAADPAGTALFRLDGRIRAWLLLLATLIVVFVIAGLLGFFNV